jgi:uncharacterized membrane protein
LKVTDLINGNSKLVHYTYKFKPWDQTRELLNRKLLIKKIVGHWAFEVLMLVIVLANCFVLVGAMVSDDQETLDIFESIDNYLLYCYIIECVVKIIGLDFDGYFADAWNVFDFSLVLMSLFTDVALNMFKFARNARSAKASRVVRSTKIHRT